MLRRPSASTHASVLGKRPAIPSHRAPVSYLGGKIYDTGSKLRCYRQSTDRIERSFTYNNPGARRAAYNDAFSEIENDERVQKKTVC